MSYIMDDSLEKLIAYAPRALTAAETLQSLRKSGTGCSMGLDKFHISLYGRKFVIEYDHQPLLYIFSNSKAILPTAPSRIKRWALTLSAYSYTIRYKPGRNLGNADALNVMIRKLLIQVVFWVIWYTC